MNILSSKSITRLIPLAFLSLFLIYLLPTVPFLNKIDYSVLKSGSEGSGALAKSFSFAIITSFLTVLVSLLIAISLRKVPFNSIYGKLLILLLTPILLGNVSTAFIGKILFSKSIILQSSASLKFITVSVVNFWQFGTLYIYLYWLNIKAIPERIETYISASNLSNKEVIRDVLIPVSKNLTILLFVFHFIAAFYESIKLQLIFKSSLGTHTELISQWLNRSFHSNSLINSLYAFEKSLSSSVIVFVTAVAILVLLTLAINTLINQILRTKATLGRVFSGTFSKLFVLVIVSFVFLPIMFGMFLIIDSFQVNFLILTYPILLSALIGIFSLMISILVSAILRIYWKNTFSGFNSKSILFIVCLFFIQLTPPLIVYLVGFQWIKILHISSNIEVVSVAIWFVSHIVLITPIILSFCVITNFQISNSELAYLESQRVTFHDKLKTSFLKRNIGVYLFTLLLAFSLVWNETIINSLFSDFIPSFVSEMKMSIEGRSTDYSVGFSYLLVSIILSQAAILIWHHLSKKILK